MEARDLELIENNRNSNYELDRLYREHLDFEEKIDVLESRIGLSVEEENELKKLKKKKLDGRDKLENLLIQLRT